MKPSISFISVLRGLWLTAVSLSTITACSGEDPSWTDGDIEFFETKIRPVLVKYCYRCHSQEAIEKDQLRGGLLVDSRDGLLAGGDSGSAVAPGKPDTSLLLEALRYESYEMPPDGKLSDEVINDFVLWIERGAADPRTGDVKVPQQTIDLEAGRRHWAYQPLPLPVDSNDNEPDQDQLPSIDAYIDDGLLRAGLTPVSSADRITLARRLSFDLIGLPPTPEEIDAFLSDGSPGAYERYVDRLLASPHFGERWARHWLDVARFAESVTLRGLVQQEAWRYRDYVIDAFNNDLPYDQFLREQIAGDLMEADSLEERQRQHIATGFLTFTDANLEDQDKEKLRMDVVDEQLSVIGKAILGQTIACARCHDHKFDPIPQADYYAMAGILRNTRTMEHSNVSRWIDRPLPMSSDAEQQVALYTQQVDQLKMQITALRMEDPSAKAPPVNSEMLPGIVIDDEQAALIGDWMKSTSVKPYVDVGYQHDMNTQRGEKSAIFRTNIPTAGRYDVRISYTPSSNRTTRAMVTLRTASLEETTTINQRKRPPIDGLFISIGQFDFAADEAVEVEIVNRDADGHVIVDAIQLLPISDGPVAGVAKIDSDEMEKMSAEQREVMVAALEADLKTLEKNSPPQPKFQGVHEEADIGDMPLHIRGNVHSHGEVVPRGFLQVLSIGDTTEIPETQSGRLQLADWLADPANPLPARVYVNRVWHWLFGEGLVRTPDNFGAVGQLPTHPELLDDLAGRFVAGGWSTKKLVREIVLSDAYRRQSTPSSEQSRIDPENKLLWRTNRRRLEAECLLDAVLAVSGELDMTTGGKLVPEKLSADYDYQHNHQRRALYWPQLRNSRPELLRLFDGANPSLVTGKRNSSSVAPQALYLMNNSWLIERSQAAAKRLLDGDALSDSARIQQAFRLILGRFPTDDEERTVTAYLTSNLPQTDEETLNRWSQLVQSLIGTVDFRYLR